MKIKTGFAFHLHHEKLAEWCADYDGRVKYIKSDKPKDEQPLRLKLFRLIPTEQLPAEWRKAYAEWQKAYAEWQKAGAEWQKADAEWQKADAEWQKAGAEWQKAGAEWQKADAEWQKADAEWQKAGAELSPFFEILHKKLCKKCPWNGTTIFTRKNESGIWYSLRRP
jgi:hypothetical protein